MLQKILKIVQTLVYSKTQSNIFVKYSPMNVWKFVFLVALLYVYEYFYEMACEKLRDI